jgi:hypothetical protein
MTQMQFLFNVKCLAAVALGGPLMMVAIPAEALSGTINQMSCACKTTADFVTAATQQAHLFDQNGGGSPGGNYIIASSSGAMSAYVSVTGKYVIKNIEIGPVWVTSAVTPIDSNGISLAGQSEASRQGFYSAFDATIMATSRNAPAIINEPSSYAGSFINSDESEVVPGISRAFIDLGINAASVFSPGSEITVQFEDGTTAVYMKTPAYSTYQWVWTGVAHNKLKQKINRSGQVISNNASGGGGSFDVPGFGGGSGAGAGGFDWRFVGDGVHGNIIVEPPIVAIEGGYGGAGGAQYVSYF